MNIAARSIDTDPSLFSFIDPWRAVDEVALRSAPHYISGWNYQQRM